MRIEISKREYYELGAEDNELLGKVWYAEGWRYYRSFDGQ